FCDGVGAAFKGAVAIIEFVGVPSPSLPRRGEIGAALKLPGQSQTITVDKRRSFQTRSVLCLPVNPRVEPHSAGNLIRPKIVTSSLTNTKFCRLLTGAASMESAPLPAVAS